MNFLPGEEVIDKNDAAEIRCKISKLMNPLNIPNFDNMLRWKQIQSNILDLEIIINNTLFYLLYEHPVLSYKNKLLTVSKKDLIDFLKCRINQEHKIGLDITICTLDFTSAIICNHDGDIFLI